MTQEELDRMSDAQLGRWYARQFARIVERHRQPPSWLLLPPSLACRAHAVLHGLERNFGLRYELAQRGDAVIEVPELAEKMTAAFGDRWAIARRLPDPKQRN